MGSMTVKTHAFAATAAAATLLLSSCGGNDSSAPRTWRDIDPCTLATTDEAARTALATDDTTPAVDTTDKEGERSCRWIGERTFTGDPKWSVSIRITPPDQTPSAEELEKTELPSVYFDRTLQLDNRKAYVKLESAAHCMTISTYSDAWIIVNVDADAGSNEIELFDDSAPGCDRQKPFIESVLSRANLP